MLTVLIQFLSNQSPYVVMDGCLSKLRNVVSGVLQMEVFCNRGRSYTVHHAAFFHAG